jgi:hypothetical protein
MKKILMIFSSIPLLLGCLLIGCSNIEDSITKEEAKQLVLKEHVVHIGTPTILSIEVKHNAYYVKWENKSNKESGTDKVTKDGKVKMIDAQIE